MEKKILKPCTTCKGSREGENYNRWSSRCKQCVAKAQRMIYLKRKEKLDKINDYEKSIQEYEKQFNNKINQEVCEIVKNLKQPNYEETINNSYKNLVILSSIAIGISVINLLLLLSFV